MAIGSEPSNGPGSEGAARVREPEPGAGAGSLFGAFRRRVPTLEPARIPRWTLEALTRALEDEYEFQARAGLLAAVFARERDYRPVARRWRALAEEAELGFVLSDFERPRAPPAAPLEIPLAAGDRLAREWALICDSSGWSACLLARPASPSDPGLRRDSHYEAAWSTRPDLVRTVARSAVAAAEPALAELGALVPQHLFEPVSSSAAATAALSRRFLEYAARTRARRGDGPPDGFAEKWSRASAS